MVEPSPWPFAASWVIFGLAVSLVGYMHRYTSFLLVLGFLILLLVVAWGWFSDIIDEADSGYHTAVVQEMLRVGFLLFIVSEVMLFFSFFWALFHSSLSPSIWIGAQWVPEGITTILWIGAPLMNTLLLLASSLAVTTSHWNLLSFSDRYSLEALYREVLVDDNPDSLIQDLIKFDLVEPYDDLDVENAIAYRDLFHYGQRPQEFSADWLPRSIEISSNLRGAIYLGLLFLFFQWNEYANAGFSISDSVFGSCFFMLTGLHGLHVLVGTLFLIFCLVRIQWYGAFSKTHHVAFECAAWYWHFVDVVWLFLFFIVYCLLG